MFPVTKPALETIPPFTFTLLRFIVAMTVLVPLAARRALAILLGPDRGKLIVMGLLGFCIAQVSQTMALKLSVASDIALLSTITPLWIALLARLFLGERLTCLNKLGFLVAIAGVVLILWPKESESSGLSQRVLGDMLMMVTGACWAYYNVVGKRMMERYSPLSVTAAAGVIGTLCIIPFALWELLAGHTPEFTLVGIGGIAYSGLLVTALGFPVLFWALAHVRAVDAGIMMYLQPIAGVLIAWLLLDETIGMELIIGAALVLTGVYLVKRQAQNPPQPAKEKSLSA